MLSEKIEHSKKINQIAYAIATGHSLFIDRFMLDQTISVDDYQKALRKAVIYDGKLVEHIFSRKYIQEFIGNRLSDTTKFEAFEALVRNDYFLLRELVRIGYVRFPDMLCCAIDMYDYELWSIIKDYKECDLWFSDQDIFEKLAKEIALSVRALSIEPLFIFDEEVGVDTSNLKILINMLKDMVNAGVDTRVKFLNASFDEEKQFITLLEYLEGQTERREKYKEVNKIIEILKQTKNRP